MNMTVAAYGAAFCALWGAASLLAGIHTWAEDRFTRDGWRIRRRWDRPGAEVILPDGRRGCLETIYRGEAAGTAAVVIFEDCPPEWMPLASLSPVPAAVTA